MKRETCHYCKEELTGGLKLVCEDCWEKEFLAPGAVKNLPTVEAVKG